MRFSIALLLTLSQLVTAKLGAPVKSSNDTVAVETHRTLYATKSKETVLAIRLRALTEDGQDFRNTVQSHDEVVDLLFADSNSAKSQFEACSGGDFTIEPFVTTRTPQGVRMFTVYQPINELTTKDLTNIANERLCRLWDLPQGCNPASDMGIDHIAYIIPHGVSDAGPYGKLYGSVGGTKSVFVDSSHFLVPSFSIEGILHEFAHNWQVGHAREDGQEYGDNTGPMGSSYYLWGSNNGDARCFNGWNMYELGWFKEKTIEIPEGDFRMIDIRGVADDEDKPLNLIIKYKDYYITYNRASGPNAATKEYPNMVVVVKKVPDQNGWNFFETSLVGALWPIPHLGPQEVTLEDNFRVQVCPRSQLAWPATEITLVAGYNAACTSHQTVCVPNGGVSERQDDCCTRRWHWSSKTCRS